MSTEIYYFSGTGNSLYVAQELQKRLPDAKLIPILSLSGLEAPETHSETVGFVFPVYVSSIPVPVRKFLRKLDLSSTHYIFAIATRAGSLSLADVSLKKYCRKKENH